MQKNIFFSLTKHGDESPLFFSHVYSSPELSDLISVLLVRTVFAEKKNVLGLCYVIKELTDNIAEDKCNYDKSKSKG